jgi:hypothetical protein
MVWMKRLPERRSSVGRNVRSSPHLRPSNSFKREKPVSFAETYWVLEFKGTCRNYVILLTFWMFLDPTRRASAGSAAARATG